MIMETRNYTVCYSCKYKELSSVLNPCYRCVNGSEYVSKYDYALENNSSEEPSTAMADTAKVPGAMITDSVARIWERCESDVGGRCIQCPLYNVTNCRLVLEKLAELDPDITDTAKADAGEPHMSYDERRAAYRDAIDRWGRYGQIWMAVEEMSELTNALCKLRRDRCSVHDVAEEIADVTIMMEQLRMIFDVNEEVSGIMDKKVERLRQRLFSFGEEGEHA